MATALKCRRVVNERLKAFIKHPPLGSKTYEAARFGVDLSLLTQNVFGLTPAERLDRMQADQIDASTIRVISRSQKRS